MESCVWLSCSQDYWESIPKQILCSDLYVALTLKALLKALLIILIAAHISNIGCTVSGRFSMIMSRGLISLNSLAWSWQYFCCFLSHWYLTSRQRPNCQVLKLQIHRTFPPASMEHSSCHVQPPFCCGSRPRKTWCIPDGRGVPVTGGCSK